MGSVLPELGGVHRQMPGTHCSQVNKSLRSHKVGCGATKSLKMLSGFHGHKCKHTDIYNSGITDLRTTERRWARELIGSKNLLPSLMDDLSSIPKAPW